MGSIAKEQEIANLENQLKQELQDLRIAESNLLAKKKEKLILENQASKLKEEISDLTEATKQARFVVEQTKIDISLKTKEFWGAKRAGE